MRASGSAVALLALEAANYPASLASARRMHSRGRLARRVFSAVEMRSETRSEMRERLSGGSGGRSDAEEPSGRLEVTIDQTPDGRRPSAAEQTPDKGAKPPKVVPHAA